ncbi:MAG: ATP-binding protein [Porticoccus sp.]|jgi:signal transduction histidine kinase|uniref:sensor histidine kinase n=1 Tax=Porticoccus sp. TaxID=2024853 RepID=UPI0032991AF4|tara:strand:+ start:25336 stop:26481 length:1146 start_codon:yes stop_codon:yes gene_type:complete
MSTNRPDDEQGQNTVLPPSSDPGRKWSLRCRALLITAVYAIVASLWIYASDHALMALAADTETFSRWSVYKGIGFVLITSLLLLLLIWWAFGALEKAYADLKTLNQNLEKRVRTRTNELQSVANRAETADQLKSSFLATMSHELRTPLNSIIGFTGIILQGMAGPITREQTKQLGMVRSSARHLLDLINDVLDISKIEAGQLQVRRESFDLAGAIDQVIGSVKPLAERKGLSLHRDIAADLSTMCSDRRRVEQILLNLLNNAIKFTDRGSVALHVELEPAWVPTTAVDSEDNRAPLRGEQPVPAVRFRVTDTGIGIRPEDIEQLFKPFNQVDSGLTRQHDGTGLGLAICSRLTNLLGGAIKVDSQWSQGSEFTVILPLELS